MCRCCTCYKRLPASKVILIVMRGRMADIAVTATSEQKHEWVDRSRREVRDQSKLLLSVVTAGATWRACPDQALQA